MAAASSEPSAQGPARRLGLLYSAIACLIVFAEAAWWSWRYAALPDPFKPAESRTFWQGLTTPIEHNAFRRLPVITGDLHGVFALKGTEHVWAVGQGGMILHSADGGESWERQSDIERSPTAPKETEPAAENDAIGLIRSAHAGQHEKESAGQRAGQPPPDINPGDGGPPEINPGDGDPPDTNPGSGGPGEGGPGSGPGPGGFDSVGSGSTGGGFPDQSSPAQGVGLRALAFADGERRALPDH